jgi:sugar phosphate isomerase/epimerase
MLPGRHAMFKTAFSTVACPDWILPDVLTAAAEWGYDGVEMRTFGYGSAEFACDPALTAAEKIRGLCAELGVEPAVLGTGVSFDEPVRPAVIGWAVADTERTVRAAKSAIELAASIECPLVRVFGFESRGREKRPVAIRRIAQRLRLAIDGARNTGVRLVLENGGSFATAAEVLELLDAVGSPALGVAYSPAVARAAGEDPLAGAAVLADRLWVAKVRDYRAGEPVVPGDGEVGMPEFIAGLRDAGFSGWAVVEWDRAWLPGLAPAEVVLPEAVRRLYGWAAATRRAGSIAAETVSMR